MSYAGPKNTKLDNLYLKFFKYAVVGLMTLALLSVVVLLPMAAYNYLQSPAPPVPAKAPPERSVSTEDLKRFLIDEEKRRQDQEKNGNAPVSPQAVKSPVVTQLYNEQAIALYRCSEDFRTAAQQETDNSTPTEIALRNESLRVNIERLADNKYRGANWVAVMVIFTCSVLKNPEIAKLKREKAVGAVVSPTINFHAKAWATIETEKAEFRQSEELRVQQEAAAETLRVAAAKAKALFILSLAGGAVLFFLIMALYLIFAKIEDNLSLIQQAIIQRTLPEAGHA